MSTIELKVPDIGDFTDVAVIEVLVKVGDKIAKEQSLITVESDKASMEVPASAAGTVKEIKVKEGDTVNEGSVILLLEAEGTQSAAAKEVKAEAPTAAAVAPTAASASDATIEVTVPDIGDFQDVTVIEILVKPGDAVEKEQSLITVESDKASMEVPTSAAGVVEQLKVKVGDTVNKGDLIALLKGAASAVAPAPQKAEVATPAPASSVATASAPALSAPTAAPVHQPTAIRPDQLPYASPSIRKLAREFGVPLEEVAGTGQKGRIIATDIQSFVAKVMSGAQTTKAQQSKGVAGGGAGLDLLPWPTVNFEQFGEVARKPLPRIKKISGANLHRNWVMIPHVTCNDEADITSLEDFRKLLNKEGEKAKNGVRYTFLAFIVKACVAGLKKYPLFNTSLQGDDLIHKKYYNIGFAADTPNGLMVPVIKNADQKGLAEIVAEITELSAKAREGKLSPAEMSGGCFTISSLGGIGGGHFTPIINAPEVGILGVGRNVMKPVWNGKEFEPRLMLPLSLSFDHRVIDGALGAQFNAYLVSVLSDYRRVLL